MKLSTPALWLVSCVALLVLTPAVADLAAEQAAPRGGRDETPFDNNGELAHSKGEFRQREGVTLEQEGYVQFTGERLTFVSLDGKQRLVMLENLALDRVSRAVRDSSAKTRWKVFGTLTEYQGANYLYLNRAVLVHREDELGS